MEEKLLSGEDAGETQQQPATQAPEKPAGAPSQEKEFDPQQMIEGSTYLIIEESPQASIKLYTHKLGDGYEGLLISRLNPKQLARQHEGIDGSLYWLTTVKASQQPSVSGLQELSILISNFIDKNKKTVILLDGLEYLVSNNDYSIVLRLIQQVRDKVSTGDSILLIPVNPSALNEKELTLLKRECSRLK